MVIPSSIHETVVSLRLLCVDIGSFSWPRWSADTSYLNALFSEIPGILGHDLRLGVRGAVRLDLGEQLLKRRCAPCSCFDQLCASHGPCLILRVGDIVERLGLETLPHESTLRSEGVAK
jgi:hypothetical protein